MLGFLKSVPKKLVQIQEAKGKTKWLSSDEYVRQVREDHRTLYQAYWGRHIPHADLALMRSHDLKNQ